MNIYINEKAEKKLNTIKQFYNKSYSEIIEILILKDREMSSFFKFMKYKNEERRVTSNEN